MGAFSQLMARYGFERERRDRSALSPNPATLLSGVIAEFRSQARNRYLVRFSPTEVYLINSIVIPL
jgi:hypothetical protein